MKTAMSVLIAFLMAATVSAQENLPDDARNFVSRFEKAVMTHHYDSVMEYMDNEYMKLQYKKLLKKDQEQFIDEFFSGYEDVVHSKGFTNTRLPDISAISFEKSRKLAEDEYEVMFRVLRVSGYAHYCTVMLRKYKGQWGFFGAMG